MPHRGEVWLANLDPPHGTEPGKPALSLPNGMRPALIVQAQALLEAGNPSTLIIPLTTNVVADAEPLRVRVPPSGRLRHGSDLLIDQLRAIDNRRLVQGPLTRLSSSLMREVADAIHEVLELDDG